MKGAARDIVQFGGGPRAVALVVLIAVLGIGIWILSSDARREIDALATANSDSTQWSLAQAEVEFLQLETAVLSAEISSEESLRELRRRFDVFYSRMNIIRNSPTFDGVRERPEVEVALTEITTFLNDTVPLIDGPDASLEASLRSLWVSVSELEDDVRAISLAGVTVFAGRSEIQRERVAAALFDLALVSVLLVILMLGLVLVLVGLLRSSRDRAEQIRTAESRLRAIASTALDGIVVANHEGRILEFNGAAESIFGYTPNEAIGQTMSELIVPDHMRDAHEAGMKRYNETRQKRVIGKGRVQLEAKDKSGRVFPVELSISTAKSVDGEIFVSFIRDISRRVAAEKELIDARDKALAGEKAKAELLAIMSHEMRTPLNGILGTLQLLESTNLDARQKEFADVMETSGKMLLRHVNTVLDISRADAGMVEAAREVFSPDETLREIAGSLKAQAEFRSNRLEIRSGGHSPGNVIGDEGLLRQVLTNLVGNAIKFTENGHVTLECERLAENALVEFRVADTGIGIAHADLTRIFEDFVTLDPSYTREVEGTGLGLGIVRRLVSVMGGEIGLESDPGDGSVFWVRLPLPETERKQERSISSRSSSESDADRRSISALLVEDNEINRVVARNLLAELDCEVLEAHDGREGVARANERAFDVIFMDISMPHLDGIEATRQIRRGAGLNATTPIIALTAHALPDDIMRFQSAGMSDVIVKPLERGRLAAALVDIQVSESGRTGSVTTEEQGGLISGLDEGLARNLVARANSEISNGLVSLVQRLDDIDNVQDLRAEIHKLVGLSAVIGAAELREALAAAETASVTNDHAKVLRCLKDATALAGKGMPPGVVDAHWSG